MLPIYHDLGVESRRTILKELLRGPRSVTDLVEATGFKQPNVSNHLAKMRESGSVQVDRNGRQMLYRLGSPEVEQAVRLAVIAREAETTQLDLPELAGRYAHFAVVSDETRCTDIVDFALRSNQPLIDIYENLMARSMVLVGQMYDQQTIDEAQEHVASEITERLLVRIITARPPKQLLGLTAVLGCAANNWHTIGLRIIADYLRSEGWKIVFLGANVPTEAFSRAVGHHNADVVFVSSSTESIQEARSLIRELKRAHPNVALGLGGSGVVLNPERFEDLPTDLRGSSLRETLGNLDAWIQRRAG